MRLELIKPTASLNKAYRKTSLKRDQIELFKANLKRLFDRINDQESEEHLKNIVSDFLKDTWYKNLYETNTKGRADLVIHNGKSSSDTVGVIFEVKRPVNKSEMISAEKPNEKALHELLNYYLDERYISNNKEIKHLIITNIHEWYIFDGADFERFFFENQKLIKQYKEWHDGLFGVKLNDWFYKEVAKPFIEKELTSLKCTYFDLNNYQQIITNEDKSDDVKLVDLYKTLSPENLLKKPFANDSNSLDKAFYAELLHIIGLNETKDGSKKLIGRKKEGHRDPGSMIENSIVQIDSRDMISRIAQPSRFGETQQERLLNVSLDLVITWINRILFLKLLEAQLIKYHKGDTSYAFLTREKINGYDSLDSLFFRVLAKKTTDRDPAVIKVFEKVPYLNSSLFEPTELERETIFISNLQDDCLIPVHPSTVLKGDTGKRLTGTLTGLNYLFAFLDAYDFSGEGRDEIQEENKTLINASVLGLIFEKINGYKDGSFFTPGFITMYMCRETIRRAVVQKFNDRKGWNCENLSDLYDKIEDRKEASDIINSLKICDPAVGSGHFLVSSLNEIIAIKSELKILSDKEGKRLKEYHVEVANDELIITDEDGELFEYNPKNPESQRVQETLFREKQNIIENCLFGVDINPNSVKICRLRLWIELLKNAYYLTPRLPLPWGEGELETLPNIDINIKCGNSLISRYALDADIKQALKKSKWSIDSYRMAVQMYRNATNKEQKREMERLIETIKTDFETEVAANDKRLIQLRKLNAELFNLTNQTAMFEKTKKELADWNKKVNELTSKIKRLETELEEIKNNKIYENAFEWRFEFPEVLNNDGDFVGFDVVIGNPPYGVSIKGQYRNAIINHFGKIPDFEIYFCFIELGKTLLKRASLLNLIIPNSILFNVYAKKYRLSLLEKWELIEILDCSSFNIFEDATVRNAIIQFKKAENASLVGYRNTLNALTFYELSTRKSEYISISILKNNNQNWGLVFRLSSGLLAMTNNIKQNHVLIELFDVSQGYIPYRRNDLIKRFGIDKGNEIVDQRAWHSSIKINEEYKEELFGRNISKYSYSHSGSYVWYGKHLACYVDLRFFSQKRIVVREITNPTVIACLIEEEFVNDPQLINVIPKSNPNSVSLEFLWGLLNSKLATFLHFNSSPKATKGAFPKILIDDLKNFPIPELNSVNEQLKFAIENLVKKIIAIKQSDPPFDATDLEKEIDQLVYKLYGLTEEEIKIVENS